MPSQKSAQQKGKKAGSDLGGKPGQPKKASAKQSAQKKKEGPVAGGTV